jgi:hypothetical protein
VFLALGPEPEIPQEDHRDGLAARQALYESQEIYREKTPLLRGRENSFHQKTNTKSAKQVQLQHPAMSLSSSSSSFLSLRSYSSSWSLVPSAKANEGHSTTGISSRF